MLRPRFSYLKLFFLNIILAFCIIPINTSAQVYVVNVNDALNNGAPLGGLDSALVTFGDSTKYTDENGTAIFYNPTVSVEDNGDVPVSFKISSAYPNPVKGDEVKVDFETEDNSVSVEVYNILGERVGLYKGNVVRGGNSVTMEGMKGLPFGIYFTRITGKEGSRVVKFVNLNNGGNGNLKISVSDVARGFASPEAEKDSYVPLHIEKAGYIDYDANIDPSEYEINVDLRRAERTISGSVFDNVKYTFGNREPLEAKVTIYYDGNAEERRGSVFDFRIPTSVEFLDSIKCVGTGEDTSFVLTYKNFPVEDDMIRLDFLVTTFNGLIYGYNVPDDSAVTVEQFEIMAAEGIFRPGYGGVEGARGINVDNLNNPIYENPDPATDHGYEIVIPLGHTAEFNPNVNPWTPEEQQQLKEIIENDIETKYPEGKRMRVRILTENDTLPIFWSPEGYPRPYPGVSIVSQGNGGFTYSFGAFDYNYDGWTDAAFITVGADFATALQGTRQELHSIYITMPLEPTFIPGDVSHRSVFLQSGYSAYDFTPTVDNKLVNGILMNLSKDVLKYYDNNGEERIKVNYIPKKPQREILGL